MSIKSKFWTESATALGVSSALISFFPLSNTNRIFALLVVLLGLSIRGVKLTLQNRRRNAFNANFLLSSNLTHNQDDLNDKFSVQICKSQSDIVRVSQFDLEFFPEESFAADKVLKMWERFPRAITYITYRNEIDILALISIWPITKNAYSGLVSGDWAESDVQPRHILKEPNHYWWIGSLEVNEKLHKNRSAFNALLTASIANWIYELKLSKVDHVHVVATAQSKKGMQVLRHLGFVIHREKEPQTFAIDGSPDDITKTMSTRFPHLLSDLNARIASLNKNTL